MTRVGEAVSPWLSVVIAARNEAPRLPSLLADLGALTWPLGEVVVVDGHSDDGTATLARLAGARVCHGAPCRGAQLAAGVAASGGSWLLLLHADARLPANWRELVGGALGQGEATAWAFHLAIDGPGPQLRLVETLVGLRSRWRGLPYGDQGLLVSRRALEAAGGIAPIPLMEDLDLVLRLGRRGPIRLLPAALRVSARRWRRLGLLATALANARLRRAWRRGESPQRLAQRYYGPTSLERGPVQGAYQKAQRRC
jgi:rSAM/selenodomain-associated transferase 2